MERLPALLHAAGVVALAGAIITVFFLALWIIGVLVDGRRLRVRREEQELARRVREDEEREKRMAETMDETKPYPPDWPEGGAFV